MPVAHPVKARVLAGTHEIAGMVGDLRMWLYRATPGNPRQLRRRRPLSTDNRTPRPAGGYGSILSKSTGETAGSPRGPPSLTLLAPQPPLGAAMLLCFVKSLLVFVRVVGRGGGRGSA